MSMKQIQHVLLQYFLFIFRHLFFGQEVKASRRSTHFTRKSYPNHDQIQVFDSWNFQLGIKSIRSDETLESYFHNFLPLFRGPMDMLLGNRNSVLLHTFS